MVSRSNVGETDLSSFPWHMTRLLSINCANCIVSRKKMQEKKKKRAGSLLVKSIRGKKALLLCQHDCEAATLGKKQPGLQLYSKMGSSSSWNGAEPL